MKKFIIAIIVLCFPYFVSGGALGTAKIHGKVLKYDKNSVTLVLENNHKLEVPRETIKEPKLKRNKKVVALFTATELMELFKNKKQ